MTYIDTSSRSTGAAPGAAVSRRLVERIDLKQILFTVVTYAVMIGVAVSTVGPFVIMLSVSLTKDIRFITFPMPLLPNPFTLENFDLLFSKTMAGRWLFNSFYTATVATLGGVITSAAAGYAFARGEFWGRDFLFMLFLGILMMPATALIVPLFIVLARLGLINTYTALIGPWFASIFGTFMLRQQYLSIPRDYDDAATIDGASLFQIWWQVLLPQLKPAMATLAILRFMGHWNSFLYPMIVTSKAHLRTLTVGLGTVVRSGGDAGLDMAGAVLGFMPTFLIFMIGQKYIIQGVALSGIKG